MNRRTFLGSILSGAAIYLVSRLPWNRYGAVFRVVKVNPDGSGAEYSGHLGVYVYNAERCCQNCQVIFAAWRPGGDVENGPSFDDDELSPANPAATRMMAVVKASKSRHGTASFELAT